MSQPIASYAATTQASSLTAAAGWVEASLLGSTGTAIAVLAVAAFGFAMLAGRLHLRRGMRIAIGAFILFGAPTIAAALTDGSLAWREGVLAPAAPPPPTFTPPSKPPTNSDPYAGASVPR
jgi:type IV secretory pathway VirB2 component (pilin)